MAVPSRGRVAWHCECWRIPRSMWPKSATPRAKVHAVWPTGARNEHRPVRACRCVFRAEHRYSNSTRWRDGLARGRRSPNGAAVPEVAPFLQLSGHVRVPSDPRSTLYNTDGQIFSDAGVRTLHEELRHQSHRLARHARHDGEHRPGLRRSRLRDHDRSGGAGGQLEGLASGRIASEPAPATRGLTPQPAHVAGPNRNRSRSPVNPFERAGRLAGRIRTPATPGRPRCAPGRRKCRS